MSKINVDTIDKQSGSTVTIGGPGTNLILGTSSQSVTLGTGATQSGFGRTGTVDWQTGSIKTGTFTAVSGEGYFVNTSGGVSTVNLPAGVAGAIVGLKDYLGNWQTNAVTLNPNGSDKIGGGNAIDPTLTAEGGSVLLVFVDSTQGWLTTSQSVTESPSGIESFLCASGGTVLTVGDFKTHVFTGSGTFTVNSVSTNAPSNNVDYLVVAGGASGGRGRGGGGGAGGFRTFSSAPGNNSPLSAPNGTPVSVQAYPITIGAGGAGQPSGGAQGVSGTNSIFSAIISAGGGGGAQGSVVNGQAGGSGG